MEQYNKAVQKCSTLIWMIFITILKNKIQSNTKNIHLFDDMIADKLSNNADGSSANINFSKTQLSRMILSRGILADLRAAQIMFYTTNNVFDWSRSIKKKSKKGVTLAKNVAPELAENLTGYYVKKGIN